MVLLAFSAARLPVSLTSICSRNVNLYEFNSVRA